MKWLDFIDVTGRCGVRIDTGVWTDVFYGRWSKGQEDWHSRCSITVDIIGQPELGTGVYCGSDLSIR